MDRLDLVGGAGEGADPAVRSARLREGVTGSSGGAERRHVLVIANRLPYPLDDGWKVRTFHVIRGISTGARTTLVVFHAPGDRATVDEAAAAFGGSVRILAVRPPRAYTPLAVLRGLLSRQPVHVWNQESARLRELVRGLLRDERIDLVVAESTFLARYLDLVPPDVPRIIDTHNVDSVTFSRYASAMRGGIRRWYSAVTADKLRAFESETFRRCNGVWVCSDVERELVHRMAPGVPVWTVPNGVDTDSFSPPGGARPVRDRLLFFGRLDYYPNVEGLAWFCREILPRLKRARPQLDLRVVGAGANREVRALARSEPAFRLVGRVPDLSAEIACAGAVVVPLRVGGGTRLKILEALAMARPVVSTTVGAEGLEVEHGRHLLIADEPAAFAEAVLSVLDEPAAAALLGAGGRALVRERYDWDHVHRVVANSLQEVADAGSA